MISVKVHLSYDMSISCSLGTADGKRKDLIKRDGGRSCSWAKVFLKHQLPFQYLSRTRRDLISAGGISGSTRTLGWDTGEADV